MYISLYILIPVAIILVGLGYSVVNLLFKTESIMDQAEEANREYLLFVADVIESVNSTYNQMVNVDKRAMFQSDDDVGVIFNSLKDLITRLNTKFNSNKPNI